MDSFQKQDKFSYEKKKWWAFKAHPHVDITFSSQKDVKMIMEILMIQGDILKEIDLVKSLKKSENLFKLWQHCWTYLNATYAIV